MKCKRSITLSKGLLDDINRALGNKINRSKLIEIAVRDYLERRKHERRNHRELKLLNRHATELNREAKEILSYQVMLGMWTAK